MTEEAMHSHVTMSEGQTAFCSLHFYYYFPTLSTISLRNLAYNQDPLLHATVDAFHEYFEPLSMHFLKKKKKKRNFVYVT